MNNTNTYIYSFSTNKDEILYFNKLYNVEKLKSTDVANKTNLNIIVYNLFNSFNSNLFSRNIKEYYQFNFNLCKKKFLSSDDFNLALNRIS